MNKEGYTPVNAACLNRNIKCLTLLMQYGGSLECVSTAHRESAVVSAHKTRHKRTIKFVNLLLDKEAADDQEKVR